MAKQLKLFKGILKGLGRRLKKSPLPKRRKKQKKLLVRKVVAPKQRSMIPVVIENTITQQTSQNAFLPAQQLIRPDEQLKKSIESFLLDQRSEHTRRAYGKDLKRFVSYLSGRKLRSELMQPTHGSMDESIDRPLIIGYKDYLLSEQLEHTTVDRHLATLRSFFRWLVEDGLMTKNPAENVRFLNPKRESKTVGFTDQEVIQVLKVPNLHTKIGSLHYAVLMTLFFCGLRRSELCSIKTSQIGIERGHRFMRLQGKGNVERIVVLVPVVWNAIEHYLRMNHKDLQQDQYLFSPVRNNRTQQTQKPLDPSMIFYIVTKMAKRAGIANRVSPHSCRATAISNARDHQVPDRAIQEFAGWSTTTMITRYDKRKSALEKSAVHAITYGTDLPEPPAIETAHLVLKKS
jgi:integrase/recombinase XerD